MKAWVFAPHRDPTLVPEVDASWTVIDPARRFVERLLSSGGQAALEARLEECLATAASEVAPALLQTRAARQVLSRSHVDGRSALSALGALLSASTAPAGVVRLRLDDLELPGGSTERSADALRAAGEGSGFPFLPELEEAGAALGDAEVVRFWLEQDQQLPATLWLAGHARRSGARIELAGPFAEKHASVLLALPPFSTATLVEGSGLRWRISWPAGLTGPGEGLRWRTEDSPRPHGERWGGYLHAADLADPEALLESGLELGVLRICALGGARRALLVEGIWMHTGPVLEQLGEAGVELRAEWLLGAPGVDVGRNEETWTRWAQVLPIAPCIGVRQFHWNVSVPQGPFAGHPVTFTPREDRDLARSFHFSADATLEGSPLAEQLGIQARRLVQTGQRAPGRVGAAAALPPRGPCGLGPKVALAPDCAVVELPVGVDGADGPSVYAAHLGTGSVIALDARLAPPLLACGRGTPTAEAFAPVAPTLRARLIPALIAKGILLGAEI